MGANHSETSQPAAALVNVSTADLVARLSLFDGPPEQFLINLLALQCHVASAEAGAILRVTGDGRREVLAVYPPLAKGDMTPVWLAQAAEQAPEPSAESRSIVKALHGPEDLYGQRASRHLIMVPLTGRTGVRGLAAFAIRTTDPKALQESRHRLELTVALMSLYEMRLTLRQREASLGRLRTAMETLTAVNQRRRFAGAAMSLCNEIAARWQCDRIGLGFLKGRYVHMRAMSHTEKFSRKMKLIQDIEAAMEECLDQDLEIVYPPADDAVYVSRAADELSKRHGPMAIVSLPLRSSEGPLAVITAERTPDRPFTPDEVESLRLGIELCTPRLAALSESDRWFGARLAAGTRKGLSYVLGPRAAWAKLTAVVVLAAVLFLIFAKGQYRVQASFTLEAGTQRIVPAPFKGFLDKVSVEPGDVVHAKKGDKPVTIAALTVVADAGGSKTGRRFDFGTAGSPVADGYTRVTESMLYMAERGFGWGSQPAGSCDRGKGSEIGRDSVFTTSELTFLVDVPSGRHKVTVTLGDMSNARDDMFVYLEGGLVDIVGTAAGEVATGEYTVDVRDGQLTVDFVNCTIMARLDTSDLRLELGAARVERDNYLREAANALQARKTVEAQIARSQADKAAMKMALIQDQIRRAHITAPIDGTVLEGDIKKLEGKKVSLGDVLFRVAPLADLRAELLVEEDQIDDVVEALKRARKEGRQLKGELSTVSHPHKHIDFVVERVNPVAEVVETRNVFKVRADLLKMEEWMRPRMKGVAKVPIDRRRYVWIWTRRMVNWIRMKLWV